MRKTEVYQVRLDSQEKKQAFAVFKQLGITPAQAVRLFFKQVVLTKSIPFSIENQNIDLEQLIKLRRLKQDQKHALKQELSDPNLVAELDTILDDDDSDLFKELDELLNNTDKN